MSHPTPEREPSPRAATRLLRSMLAIDIFMIVLLAANLALILFDEAFAGSAAIREGLRDGWGGFYELYLGIHENFALIDMAFVLVFLAELLVRWVVAARRDTHRRWFYYPLIHWYDVLGCVPLGSLRMLRFLRIVTIIYRAHRMGVIDVRTWTVYRVFRRYRAILVEEVSDRVTVHVLSGVQSELGGDSKVIARIWGEAIAPHKDAIVQHLEVGAAKLVKHTVRAHQPAIDAYVARVLSRAMARSHEVFDRLASVPLIGKNVVGQIQTGVKTIAHHVVELLHEDVMRLDVERLGAEVERTLVQTFAERGPEVEGIVREILQTTIEILKDQVKIEQWKLRDEAGREVAAGAR